VLKKAELIAFLFAHVEDRDLARFQPTDSVEGILETHAILARHLVRDSRDGAQARDLTEDMEKETLEALSKHLDAEGILEYRRKHSTTIAKFLTIDTNPLSRRLVAFGSRLGAFANRHLTASVRIC